MKVTKREFERQRSVKIRQMTKCMVREVSSVHMQVFKGAMNTRLGRSYVKNFIGWFIGIEGGIALVAIQNENEGEQIVGYAVGAPLEYGKAMNRDLFLIAGWNIIIRPWLFLSYQFREIIKARLAALFKSSHDHISHVDLPAPVMGLDIIAVMPKHQGQDIGKELLRTFEQRARDNHMRSLKLSVYPENLTARRSYEKCGWVPCKGAVSCGKALCYCRIL